VVTAMVIVSGLVVMDCAVQVGQAQFPQPSAGFAPKRTYEVSYEAMWQTVLRVLEEHRITTASFDKSTGRIATDYIQGITTMYAGGLGGVGQSRYKYNIIVEDVGAGKTRVNIICKLESTLAGSTGSTPWRDLSTQNAKLVAELEYWLYEQVEKAVQHGKVPPPEGAVLRRANLRWPVDKRH